MKIPRILSLILLILPACKEGEAPDLTQYEPFVTIGFYDSTNTAVVTAIGQVTPVGATPFSFEADAAKYKFPLDINSNKTDFAMTIDGLEGNLTVEYIPRVENQVNVLRFLLENTIVTSHSYDSVKVVCEENCISNETEIKIYR